MIVRTISVTDMETNCYVVYNEETKKGFVIDPGGDYPVIKEYIDSKCVDVEAVLLTHAHFDHIGALDNFNVPVYIGNGEEEVIKNPSLNLSVMLGDSLSFDYNFVLKNGDITEVAGFSFETISTPGHTPGSVCFYFKNENVLFSGDTLFFMSIGRTDFPGGNVSQMFTSLKKLALLDNDTKVFPGHGGSTTIGYEKEHNPYVR